MQTGRGGRCSGGSRFARTAKRVHSSPHLISSSASLNLPTHSPALSLFLVHRSYFNFAKTTEFQWPNGLLKKATFKFIEERNYDTVAGGSGFLFFFFSLFFPERLAISSNEKVWEMSFSVGDSIRAIMYRRKQASLCVLQTISGLTRTQR